MITSAKLLREVDPLSAGERMARVVVLARELESSDPQQLSLLLGELSAGDAYARRLAVMMMGGVGTRGEFVAAAAKDVDPSVASLALAVPDLPDQVIVDALEHGSVQVRRLAYRRLRRDRRPDLAGRVLRGVRERWGDQEAATVLPSCDGATVAASLPELGYAVGSWGSVAARHPAVVAGFAESQLSQVEGFAARRWWQENEPLVAALVEVDPGSVLTLAERHLVGPLPHVLLSRLVRLLGVDPGRVLALLLAEPERAAGLRRVRLSQLSCRRLAGLGDDALGDLLRATDTDARVVHPVLRAVAPARRPGLFDLAQDGREMTTALIPTQQLALLPAPTRHAQARRMLALPQLVRDPVRARTMASYLPADEAEPFLRAAIGSADAEIRAHGYVLLIENAARERPAGEVADVLTEVAARIRNEREPVRTAVLAAVSRLPHHLLTPAAAPALERLVVDALDARDSSAATTAVATQLAFRVLWQSAALPDGGALAGWALATLARIGAWQAQVLTPDAALVRTVRRGQELAVWEYVRDPIAQALKRGQAWPLLRFAAILGRRAWPIADLQELLAQATLVPNDAVIREAAHLWLAAPATRTERAARLVAADASTVTLPPVLAVLVNRRTDLLDRYVLAGEPLRGRFGHQRSVWVPMVSPALVRRWSPRQQEAYRTLLRRGLDDHEGARRGRASYARALACVPGGGVGAVQGAIDGDDELIAEAALTGLAHADRPDQALPVLLAAVGGSRARVAIYAASRCARRIPPAALTVLLAPLLTDSRKVSVRKEVARLIATTRPTGALDTLLSAWDHPNQHRDVRIALTATLVPFMADLRVRTALTQAAAGADEHLAAAVAGTPWSRLAPSNRPAYGKLIRLVTRHPHAPTASAALAAVPGWFRWTPEAAEDLRDLLLDFERIDIWDAAAAGVAHPAVWTVVPDLPAALATALIERQDDGDNAGATRDLPARQRLNRLVDLVCAHAPELRLTPVPGLKLSAALAGHDGFAASAARLRILLAAPAAGVETHLEAAADLLHDRSLAAATLSHDLPPGDWSLPAVAETVDRLILRPDPAAGLLAVAATRAAGTRAGWPPSWRRRLRSLRDHPHPDVRDAAHAIPTAGE